jgi:hypothetical protein
MEPISSGAAPKREIPRTAVTSSNIVSVGYDAATQQLAVEFKTGLVYHYADVPASVADDFEQAESKGKFYVANVKGKFKSELMTGVCPACGDIGWVNVLCTDCGSRHYAEIERTHREER